MMPAMRAKIAFFFVALSLLPFCLPSPGQESSLLPGTRPLTIEGDLSTKMVAGIDAFLMRELDHSVQERQKFWRRDFSSREAYEKSVALNREHFRKCLGAVDSVVAVTELEYASSTDRPSLITDTASYAVHVVRWPVFEGVFGEGLLLKPKSNIVARVVAIPDADQTPEMLVGLAPGLDRPSQFARRLAENGCLVIVPVLINRQDTWSGNAKINRFTNQPHREWIWRQAFEMGRHILGYEIQKVLGAVYWLWEDQPSHSEKIGVIGYGEGGLLALYSAAVDEGRIEAAVVSGYFDSRQRVWEEPIYRDVFGLLHEFGDAEIASLIAPRTLVVEHSEGPKMAGPPKSRDGRGGAAPGKLSTPDFNSVESEVKRANELVKPLGNPVRLVHGNEGMSVTIGSDRTLELFLQALNVKKPMVASMPPTALHGSYAGLDPERRQERQINQLVEHTQKLLRESEQVRDRSFWQKLRTNSMEDYQASMASFKSNLWEEVMGRFPKSTMPLNARSRKILEKEKWTGYDVVLDVFPDVFAWGVLLLPKDLKSGERRPVVVCQHGLEGLPADTLTDDPKSSGYAPYKAFAARLAEHGFVVFAPHNPYRGRDDFRVLQRKAHPLKKSLFSFILAQHERLLDWLSEQPFVDPARIGFYGLSYGGKTAMRVPSLLDRYALSICSADFNEWIRKNVTVDSAYSYMFTSEYEMPEFNLGHTFNYAEMAALIAPRPFMVERGHNDGVAPDEWVAYEYAKVRRLYANLGIPERTEIEFFNGPHTIHGVGTFKFLHTHLNWPETR